MPDFIVRLHAKSVVRLNKKPFESAEGRRNLYLAFPYARVAIFDRFTQVASDVSVPDGLIVQVMVETADIDTAITQAGGIADHALSMMSCVAMCSIDSPKVVWAYDATLGIENREYRHCFYEGTCWRGSRPLNDQHLIRVLEKNYDSFLSDPGLKADFKERVQRSMMAFRRGMADNDDVLTEFLTAWSSMEGLDCVYCKVLPSSTVRKFKDGMKDVLIRLGRPEVFDPLENLRNEIAHGSLSLAQATQRAHSHVELIRQALVLMILRILKVDEAASREIVQQASYKGKYRPHVRLLATIRFDPADVQDLERQPLVKVRLAGEKYTKNGDTLGYEPDVRFEPQNLKGMAPYATEFWGDPGAPIRMNNSGVCVIRKECDQG
jgi:hypothetical protein